MDFPDWAREKWVQYEGNPIVGYFEPEKPRAAIGDPQVLVPGQFDDCWHMFYHGFYDTDCTPYFHHLVSEDGFKWSLVSKKQFNVNPTYIFKNGDEWILYYSAVLSREQGAFEKYGCVNMIRAKRSSDLENWGEDTDILVPSLPWEKEYDPEQLNRIEARNPCVVKLYGGGYRLYYSAGTVKLGDCGYEEPKYISFADAPSPLGPFEKHGEPVIVPDSKIPYRNLGAGAIKVYGCRGEYLALYNSIYTDADGHSRSAINLLKSRDGICFEEYPGNPIVVPSGTGWNGELIYQLDLVRFGGELRLYYNAREGFRDGIERIGCAVIADAETQVEKLW
ncbi:MAG: hypothetical protein GX851_07820 [Clostridiales bacterium]|nr:hypothetical protein [Clostridiales bacterium]